MAHGVSGWAANRDDGTVEVWLEGEPAGVDAVVDFLHDGPPGAEVEAVEVQDVEPEGLQGFETR